MGVNKKITDKYDKTMIEIFLEGRGELEKHKTVDGGGAEISPYL